MSNKKIQTVVKNSYHSSIERIKSKLEISLHLIFWIFIFSALNVDWTSNWFDSGIRPNTPAPLSVLVFAIFFYVNTFYLLTKYFSRKTWKKYFAYAFLLFILPELIRVILYTFAISNKSFESELFSRDSFIFASPSPLFIAINASFIYRLTRDRLLTNSQIQEWGEAIQKKIRVPYRDAILLSDKESQELIKKLSSLLEDEEIFLNPKLTLKDVAEAVDTSDKKLSYLLNQYLGSNFYEFINKYRVDKFIDEVAKSENKNLSMVGIAMNCGCANPHVDSM